MLNKTVCKQCCNNLQHKADRWSDIDDRNWKFGYVFCKTTYGIKAIKTRINDKPPEDCKYQLEHVVSQKLDR